MNEQRKAYKVLSLILLISTPVVCIFCAIFFMNPCGRELAPMYSKKVIGESISYHLNWVWVVDVILVLYALAMIVNIKTGERSVNRVLIAVTIFSVLASYYIFYVVGIFSMGSSNMVFSGWSKIKPFGSYCPIDNEPIFYTDGRFESFFTNMAGEPITINQKDIVILDLSQEKSCNEIMLKSNGELITTDATISPGDDFLLKANCSTVQPGFVYLLRITIPYKVSDAGAINKNQEIGKIRGVPY